MIGPTCSSKISTRNFTFIKTMIRLDCKALSKSGVQHHHVVSCMSRHSQLWPRYSSTKTKQSTSSQSNNPHTLHRRCEIFQQDSLRIQPCLQQTQLVNDL